MMVTSREPKHREIEPGDRFLSLDGRDEGRVVEVTVKLGLKKSAAAFIGGRIARGNIGPVLEEVRRRRTYFLVRTETHPRNPNAEGHVSRVSEKTLTGPKYQRVSR